MFPESFKSLNRFNSTSYSKALMSTSFIKLKDPVAKLDLPFNIPYHS